jgi:hypothetical protein
MKCRREWNGKCTIDPKPVELKRLNVNFYSLKIYSAILHKPTIRKSHIKLAKHYFDTQKKKKTKTFSLWL